MCRAVVRDAVAGPVLEIGWSILPKGCECTFRGEEILGNAGGREPQHPSGGGQDVELVAGVSCTIPRIIQSAPTTS
jgi:hypothetical protein